MQGWVKLHRKLVEWEWYDDIPTRLVFIDLLIRVSHKERKWQGLLLNKGSIVTTYDEIAERNKLTYDVARNTIKKLVDTHVITKQKTHNKLLINVLNYGKYQGNDGIEKNVFDHTNNTQLPNGNQTDTNHSPHEHHTLLINKNEKNVKNDKNVKNERDKKSFGKYKNIFLSHSEYTELKSKYADCDRLIEELSSYIQSEGKHYEDHFATLERWAKREAEKNSKGKFKTPATYDLSDYKKFAPENTEI